MGRIPARRFGDVDREIADTLEVGVDLHRRDDGAKVRRHRLMQRQQLEAAVVDFNVQLVDGAVAVEHPRHSLRVPPHEAVDRRADAILRQAAHFEQSRLQLFELFLEMTYGL